MKLSCIVLTVASLSVSAHAGFVSAVIDDYSAGGPGLGFSRLTSGGASISGGEGYVPAGGGFGYVSDSGDGYPGFNASAYSGVSLKVTGDLAGGSLQLYMLGADYGFVATQIDLGSHLSAGYVWITFDEIGLAAGYDSGYVPSVIAGGEGISGIGVAFSGGTGVGASGIQIDDFQFGVGPVPAPGAVALLGVAGIAGTRRRR